MNAFLLGIAGGFVAWVATMLLGQPLYTFASIRHEVAKALYLQAEEPANLSAFVREWERDYQARFVDYAGRLIAFTSTQLLAAWILSIAGFKPTQAAQALMQLAEDDVQDWAALRHQALSALKIKLPR